MITVEFEIRDIFVGLLTACLLVALVLFPASVGTVNTNRGILSLGETVETADYEKYLRARFYHGNYVYFQLDDGHWYFERDGQIIRGF